MEGIRRYKTLGFSVPPMIATRIDEVVRTRQFTRSEFFREMFRVWERVDKEAQKNVNSDEAIMKLFAEVQEEEKRNPTSKEAYLSRLRGVGADLRKQAKDRGLVVTENGEILEKQSV